LISFLALLCNYDQENCLTNLGTEGRRPDLQPLLAKMDSLQRDHELAGKSHRKVDDLGRSWLANGRLSPQDAERLATVLRQLVELYCRHIAVEDTEVFPFAANVLPSSDRIAMGTEMATRRGLGTP
jgi:hemerythrin-like domain-containing protein